MNEEQQIPTQPESQRNIKKIPKKHWMETFYVFELILILAGAGSLHAGFVLSYTLYSVMGSVLIVFGLILAFIQKRRDK